MEREEALVKPEEKWFRCSQLLAFLLCGFNPTHLHWKTELCILKRLAFTSKLQLEKFERQWSNWTRHRRSQVTWRAFSTCVKWHEGSDYDSAEVMGQWGSESFYSLLFQPASQHPALCTDGLPMVASWLVSLGSGDLCYYAGPPAAFRCSMFLSLVQHPGTFEMYGQ